MIERAWKKLPHIYNLFHYNCNLNFNIVILLPILSIQLTVVLEETSQNRNLRQKERFGHH